MEHLTVEEAVRLLDDGTEYVLLLKGSRDYAGSVRIDRRNGSEIKHNHFIFDSFPDAEIYPAGGDAVVSLPIVEHLIRDLIAKWSNRFFLLRTTSEGAHKEGYVDSETLTRDLETLIRTSTTITIIEAGSQAEHTMKATLSGSGRIRVHRGELHISDLSPEEKAQYRVGDDNKTDPFSSPENVVEHHPD